MMAYPPEQDKGRYISWFWIIFNLGGVLGGLVCAISKRKRDIETNIIRFLWAKTSIPKPRKPSPMVLILAS